MKNFSLKALGATFLAAALLLSVSLTPAQASISDTQTYYGGGTGIFAGQPQLGMLTFRLDDTAQAAGQHYYIKLDGANMANPGSTCQAQNTDQFFGGAQAATDLWTNWANSLCNVVSDTSPTIIEFVGESASTTTSGFFKLNTASLVANPSATEVVAYASSDGTNWFRLTDSASQTSIPIKKRLVYNVTGSCVASAPNSVTKDLSDSAAITLASGIPASPSQFTFSGWATTSGATTATYTAGQSYSLTTGTTLFAVCAAVSNQNSGNVGGGNVGGGNVGGGNVGGGGNNGMINVSLGLGCNNDVSIVPAGSPLSGGFWAFASDSPAGTYPSGLSVTRAGRLQGTLSSALVYNGSAKTFPVMYFPNGTTNLVLANKVGQSLVNATNGSGCTGVAPSRPAPSATLGLSLSRGSRVAQAPAPVTATGLLANAPYTVEVRSTPVIIASGNVASDGSVNYTAAIPSGLEAGWHTMIFTSTAADGTSFTSSYYFKVAGDGTLLSTSETIPAELAYTGYNGENISLLLLGGLSLAFVGAEMFMIARRKRSN